MPEADKKTVQAVANAFAAYINDALYLDEVSGQTLESVIVEVFGESLSEEALFREATLKAEHQRLPKALNKALDTDQINGEVTFQIICHALEVVFKHSRSEPEEDLREEAEEQAERSGPDWVEKHLGAKLPKTLKQVYENREQDELEDIIVDEGDLYICVTEFNSLSANGYRSVWPSTEGMLVLAYDGAGNSYVAKPQEKFKHVYFYDHEEDRMWRVGLSVPGFIKKLREYKPTKEAGADDADEELVGKWKAVSTSTDDLAKLLDYTPLYYTFETDGRCVWEYEDGEVEEESWELLDRGGRLCLEMGDTTHYIEGKIGQTISFVSKDEKFQMTYERV